MKTTNRKYKLCIIGAFPPPIHGLSHINKAMKDKFINEGIKPLVLDISSKSLNRSFINIFTRFLKTIQKMLVFAFQIVLNKIDNIYIGLSGGLGQIYDLFFITIGTIFNSKIYIHHHSFAYLNRKYLLTSLIISISKNSATHIVLCDTMGKKLINYNNTINVKILSNAVFLKSSDISVYKSPNKYPTIGFLSNISFDKGIEEYFEVIRNLKKAECTVTGLIAGSIIDIKTKKYLDSNLKEFKKINYLGKIEAQEKEDFLNKIDILLMPTKYKNEAEPLVIHEAMSHNVAVIACDRGCISNIIPKNTGIVIKKDKQYVSDAVNQVIYWIKYPQKLKRTKELSFKQFNHKKSINLEQLNKIINNILNQ